MFRKLLDGIFGSAAIPIHYAYRPLLTRAGGAREYAFGQFQEFPTMDLINGRGHHVHGQLLVLQPALAVTHRASQIFDVDKIISGELDLFGAAGVEDLGASEVTG